ncbi:MAG: hypothetical protein NTV34_06610 [Proteobacteria bacterium]|nr:hypothetical protein [Pseudomonadota bacterium]
MKQTLTKLLASLAVAGATLASGAQAQSMKRIEILESCAQCTTALQMLRNSNSALDQFSSGTRTYLFSRNSSIALRVETFASDRNTSAELPYPDYYVPLTTKEILSCLTTNVKAKSINDRFWKDNFVSTGTIRYIDLLSGLGWPLTAGPSDFTFLPRQGWNDISAESTSLSADGGLFQGNRAFVTSSVDAIDGSLMINDMIWSRDVVRSIASVCTSN